MRYSTIVLTVLTLGLQSPAFAADASAKLYKNPNCGCCDIYARHLETSGIDVETINTTNMSSVRREHAIPERLAGCHTTLIDGYVFEGMIPVRYVKRVLNERPIINGLSLPGMPVGVPGMPGEQKATLHIYYLSDEKNPPVFASF